MLWRAKLRAKKTSAKCCYQGPATRNFQMTQNNEVWVGSPGFNTSVVVPFPAETVNGRSASRSCSCPTNLHQPNHSKPKTSAQARAEETLILSLAASERRDCDDSCNALIWRRAILPLVSGQKKGCLAITLSSHFLLFQVYSFEQVLAAWGGGLQSGIS